MGTDSNDSKSIARLTILREKSDDFRKVAEKKDDKKVFINTEVVEEDIIGYKGIPRAHLQFINLVAEGETQTKAFALTCQKGSKEIKPSTRSGAWRLATQYRQLIDIERNKRLISLEKAKDIAVNNAALEAYNSVFSVAKVDSLLCEIMADTQCSTNDRLRAIDIFNRRFGLNKPATIEVSKPKIGIDLEQEDYQ